MLQQRKSLNKEIQKSTRNLKNYTVETVYLRILIYIRDIISGWM